MPDTGETPVRGMLTVAEVASQLRISRPTAYRLAKTGVIPTVRIGGTIRVPARQLVDTLARSQLRMRKGHPE